MIKHPTPKKPPTNRIIIPLKTNRQKLNSKQTKVNKTQMQIKQYISKYSFFCDMILT